jgi:dGTPase
LTSQLIGRFAGAATQATRAAYAGQSLIRFNARLVVPREIQAEIAVLKGIVAANVMSTNARQPLYTQQREVLVELADALYATGAVNLDPGFAADWDAASGDAARMRVVVDQVASLTDQSATRWHEQLVTRSPFWKFRNVRRLGAHSCTIGSFRARVPEFPSTPNAWGLLAD